MSRYEFGIWETRRWMRPTFRALAVIGALLTLPVERAASAGGTADVAARTVPGLSIGAQRLVYAGSPATQAALGRTGNAPIPAGASVIRGEVAPPPDFREQNSVLRRTIQEERSSYQSSRAGIEKVQDGIKTSTLIAGSVGVASAVTGVGAVGGAVTTAGLVLADTVVYYYSAQLDKEYAKRLSQIYGHAWAQYAKESPPEYKIDRRDAMSGDPTRQRRAIDRLIGAKAEIFADTPVAQMSIPEAAATLPFLMDAVKQGLENERSLSTSELTQIKKKVADTRNALREVRGNVAVKLKDLRNDLEQNKSRAVQLDSKVESLASSAQLTNLMLYRQFSPKDQLESLKLGFDTGMSPAERESAIATLTPQVAKQERLAAVQGMQSAANEAIAVAGSVAVIARGLNIKVPHEVDDALKVATGLVSIASGFAAGPAGGIIALAGVVGAFGPPSGGPDPETAKALKELQQSVDEVIALQKSTLEAVEKLDRRLVTQHQAVMSRLIRIEEKLDKLLDIPFSEQATKLQACTNFSTGVESVLTNGTSRPYYDAIRELVNSDPDMRADFATCDDFLRSMFGITNSRLHWYVRNRLEKDAAQSSFNPRSRTHTIFYTPVRDFALRSLALSEDPACADKMWLTWMEMKASFLQYQPSDQKCVKGQSSRIRFKTYRGDEVSAIVALGDYVYHDAGFEGSDGILFPTLLQRLLTIAPLYELRTRDGMLSDVRRIKPTAASVAPTARNRIAGLLDVMAIAMAQETMMSGAPMAPTIVKYLQAFQKNRSFGFSADGSGGPPPRLSPATEAGSAEERFWQHCDIALAPEISSAHLLCLLERHPQILSNVLSYWVQSGLASRPQGSSGVIAFDVARQSESINLMRAAVPNLEFEEDAEDVFGFVLRRTSSTFRPSTMPPDSAALEPGWYFKVNRLDGTPWYTPMPGTFEVKNLPIRYRPEAQALAISRAVAIQEFERYSALKSSKPQSADYLRFTSVLALQEAQMIERAALSKALTASNHH